MPALPGQVLDPGVVGEGPAFVVVDVEEVAAAASLATGASGFEGGALGGGHAAPEVRDVDHVCARAGDHLLTDRSSAAKESNTSTTWCIGTATGSRRAHTSSTIESASDTSAPVAGPVPMSFMVSNTSSSRYRKVRRPPRLPRCAQPGRRSDATRPVGVGVVPWRCRRDERDPDAPPNAQHSGRGSEHHHGMQGQRRP